jgi:hypothetical protein
MVPVGARFGDVADARPVRMRAVSARAQGGMGGLDGIAGA